MDWHRARALAGLTRSLALLLGLASLLGLISHLPLAHLAPASPTSLLSWGIRALLLPQDLCTHGSLCLRHLPLPQIPPWLAPPFLCDLSSDVTFASATFLRTLRKTNHETPQK